MLAARRFVEEGLMERAGPPLACAGLSTLAGFFTLLTHFCP
jgi:hypothetical protein